MYCLIVKNNDHHAIKQSNQLFFLLPDPQLNKQKEQRGIKGLRPLKDLYYYIFSIPVIVVQVIDPFTGIFIIVEIVLIGADQVIGSYTTDSIEVNDLTNPVFCYCLSHNFCVNLQFTTFSNFFAG